MFLGAVTKCCMLMHFNTGVMCCLLTQKTELQFIMFSKMMINVVGLFG